MICCLYTVFKNFCSIFLLDWWDMKEKIKKYRKKAGLTQTELGKRIWPDITDHASQNRIRRVEAGKKELTLEEMGQIEEVLQIPGNVNDYNIVIKIYPEIEALIKLLAIGIKTGNKEFAKMAWDGFETLSHQKHEILKKDIKENDIKRNNDRASYG